MWLRNVEMKLFKAGGDFELMAQRARRHWALSDATRTKGIGGHGAENETSKVVVCMAILSILNIPRLVSRFRFASRLLHFNPSATRLSALHLFSI